MFHWSRWVLCLLLSATPGAETLTLQQALELAFARNPRWQGSQAEPRVAAAGLLQAQARPNPTLQITSAADNNALTQSGFAYAQELEMGGKRQRRIEVAEAEQERARQATAEAARQLRLSVSQAYLDLLLAQGQLDSALRGHLSVLASQAEPQ